MLILIGLALQVWSASHRDIMEHQNKWWDWRMILFFCSFVGTYSTLSTYIQTVISSGNTELSALYCVTSGHCRGFSVAFFLGLWVGSCHYCRAAVASGVVTEQCKNTCTFQGDLCMCGLSQCICLPSGAKTMMLFVYTYILLLVVLRKIPIPPNYTSAFTFSQLCSFLTQHLSWTLTVVIFLNIYLNGHRRSFCWFLIHEPHPLTYTYKTHGLHVP